MHNTREKSGSTFTPSGSPRVNSGENKLLPEILYILICGTITLNPPKVDNTPIPPGLPSRDSGELVFAEPWQAQAFALAVKLSENGCFTWKEWTEALAKEIKTAVDRGEADDGTRYYNHWLAALESLVSKKGLATDSAMLARKEEWADAYRHTPHGQPVELKRNR
jgi:nitrile hydratase accessory protein